MPDQQNRRDGRYTQRSSQPTPLSHPCSVLSTLSIVFLASLCGDIVAPAGMTLEAGLYKSSSGMALSADLTLDARDNGDAVWIFQMASTFVSAFDTKIILVNGAKASNIFWQVRKATHVHPRQAQQHPPAIPKYNFKSHACSLCVCGI